MGNSIREVALKWKAPTERLRIPEWGAEVEVRGMSLGGQSEFLASLPDEGSPNRMKKMMAQTIIRTVFDPLTGEPVFEQADAEHIINEGDVRIFRRMIEVANRLMGLESTEEIEERLGKDHDGD